MSNFRGLAESEQRVWPRSQWAEVSGERARRRTRRGMPLQEAPWEAKND
jgi:hypothetical protein